MPRLSRRRLRLITLRYEIRNAWPSRQDWLAFWAVAIPILTAAVVVAVMVTYR